MIMTDADLDGSHIKGLVLNMIHHFWPELISLGFLVAMVTPVIKCGSKWFFTEEAYKKSGARGTVKYYKGLGTSTSAEAKEYFKDIDHLTVRFDSDESVDTSMMLAFSKSMADERKSWLVRHMNEPPAGVDTVRSPDCPSRTLSITTWHSFRPRISTGAFRTSWMVSSRVSARSFTLV